ncbi:Aste57867_19155 [Aphanomyces stellatus]|uniref:beta-glucosidase n=1 Tax=Aphanomyces stellatus TaxID=120398 RepID=A0A485LCR0_9STRA|nr:hypothetical protein As57867_019091 [Aphanomyces stellatus]VFT95877.1 Aste57867_19155 [Aphanomyces stellatus]
MVVRRCTASVHPHRPIPIRAFSIHEGRRPFHQHNRRAPHAHFRFDSMKIIAPIVAVSWCAALAQGQGDLDAQATAIIERMSLDELIGQMTQVNIDYVIQTVGDKKLVVPAKIQELANQTIGSYLNSPYSGGSGTDNIGWNVTEWRAAVSQIQSIHKQKSSTPIVYGLDSLHGANYVKGAVMFPHQINVGATFDPQFANSMGQYAGRDTKAGGMTWIFGPCLEVVRHKQWPRIFETYGEDPLVVSHMAKAVVEGIQSNNVAACFKHYIGYSASATGHDRDPVTLTTHEILNLFVPSFKAAIDAGIMTGMDSYIALNGTPMSANKQMHRDLLRHDLHFDGMFVSDWEEIYMMEYFHHFSTSRNDSVSRAMNNGTIDMSMVPNDTSFIGYMKTLYAAGQIPLERIKTSAKRIVKLKLKLNLYKDPVPGADLAALVGDAPSRTAALAAARESLVLLKNDDDILPLDPSLKFFFTGSSMHDIGLLCGGWSLTWQGQAGNDMFPKYGRTIKDAMASVVNDPARALYYQGVGVDGKLQDINIAKELAQNADYTVVAIGERSYAELLGNSDPPELPTGMTDYVKALASTGTKIILILVEGRPRLLNGIPDVAAAILYAGLPCEMGGEAISDVLFGKVNPSGKMAMTYPKTADYVNLATPYYGRRGDKCVVNGVPASCPVEWHFGYGLSYTTFDYVDMDLSTDELTPTETELTVTVTVSNGGAVKGKEVVLLFVSSPNVPETKLLKKYAKVELAPGQETKLKFKLTPEDFGFYVNEIGQGLRKAASTGMYYVAIQHDTVCGAATIGPFCQAFKWTN